MFTQDFEAPVQEKISSPFLSDITDITLERGLIAPSTGFVSPKPIYLEDVLGETFSKTDVTKTITDREEPAEKGAVN